MSDQEEAADSSINFAGLFTSLIFGTLVTGGMVVVFSFFRKRYPHFFSPNAYFGFVFFWVSNLFLCLNNYSRI
jgi:hypothetical protein